jgi:hypothetical protein
VKTRFEMACNCLKIHRIYRRWWLAGAVLLACGLFGSVVWGHSFSPAQLVIVERGVGVFDMRWEVPRGAVSNHGHAPLPTMMGTCSKVGDVQMLDVETSTVYSWKLVCIPDNSGPRVVELPSLGILVKNVVIRYQNRSGNSSIKLVPSEEHHVPLAEVPTAVAWPGVRAFVTLGWEHILKGFDHLAFVLCLVLLVPKLRKLAWVITCFTIAHSITLAMAWKGWIPLAQAPVEVLIALSIVVTAHESWKGLRSPGNVAFRAEQPLSSTAPLAFGFGLLHGMGFADALRHVGVPQQHWLLSLLGFNVGVELGQLVVVGVIVLGMSMIARRSERILYGFQRVLVYVAGTAGMIWFWQRLGTMLF